MELLKDYDLGVNYTPRKGNMVVDALRRKAYCSNLMVQENQPELSKEFEKLNLYLSVTRSIEMMEIQCNLREQVWEAQTLGKDIAAIKEKMKMDEAPEFIEDDKGTLLFQGRLSVQNNKEIYELIMKEAHESTYSILLGSTKMYDDLQERYWWPSMRGDIATYVSLCHVCQQVKAQYQKPARRLQPLQIPEWKWEEVGMDFIMDYPELRED